MQGSDQNMQYESFVNPNSIWIRDIIQPKKDGLKCIACSATDTLDSANEVGIRISRQGIQNAACGSRPISS